MGKLDKEAVAPVVKIKKAEGPKRHKRNMFQRKCLSKTSKFMFADYPRSVRRMVLSFEQRNKARTTG